MATISSITEVTKVIGVDFNYEPGTTGTTASTSVTYDGQTIPVTVTLPSYCPAPDECDCDDFGISSFTPDKGGKLVWNTTYINGDCNGGTRHIVIRGTSGSTPVSTTTTITYPANNGEEPITSTSRITISGSPAMVYVTVPVCEKEKCTCTSFIVYGEGDESDPSVSEIQYKWEDTLYECDYETYTQYQTQEEMVSYDGGVTWKPTGNINEVTIPNSVTCGYVEPVPQQVTYRTETGATYCVGQDKMADTWQEVSRDGGNTWSRTGVTGRTVIEYNSPDCGADPSINYSTQYLTIESLEDGNIITFKSSNSANTLTISASTDNGETWSPAKATIGGYQMATLNAGDKILLKGRNERYYYNETTHTVLASKNSNVYGNIMSLRYGDDFRDKTTISNYNLFYGIFSGNTGIISSRNLKLPATRISQYCYYCMFYGCTNMIDAPELPATTLDRYCYQGMFEGCTSLSVAPELPATEVKQGCYYNMFRNCTSLTTAPSLKAKSPKDKCYFGMFYGCTNLSYIECLATDANTTYTQNWVHGVASTGTFVKAETVNPQWLCGDSGIPSGWTGCEGEDHHETPEPVNDYLTVKILGSPGTFKFSSRTGGNVQYSVNNGEWKALGTGTQTSVFNTGDAVRFRASGVTVYESGNEGMGTLSGSTEFEVYGNVMSLVHWDNFENQETLSKDCQFARLFLGNTGLKSARDLKLPSGSLTSKCFYLMFSGCTSLEYAPALNSMSLANYCYSSMFEGCTSLTTAPSLPATTMKRYCYHGMFKSCISLVSAPALSATTLDGFCYDSMFAMCTSLVNPPALNAERIAPSAYQSMFSECTSLVVAPSLPGTTLDTQSYYAMFSGCTSLTTAPDILPATEMTTNCYNSMFYGCTSLVEAPEIRATVLNQNCFQRMFADCTSLETAPDIIANSTYFGSCKEMFVGCSSLKFIRCMLTPDISHMNNWVDGVAASGTFVKRAGTTWTTGVNGIPVNWDVNEEGS